MNKLLKRTWAEINLDHLEYNINSLRGCLPKSTDLMAIVKADAYGHGDKAIVTELCRLGIRFFGVSNLEEALSLRNAGADGDILILGVTPAEYADVLAQQNISQSVFCTEYAEKLSQAAATAGVTVKCHLKIDTGMGRIGFVNQLDSDATQEVLSVCKLQNLSFEGIFSHFSVADELSPESLDYTDAQQNAFNSLVQRLQESGIRFHHIHLQNSAGIIRHPNPLCNLARMGISMYGLSPSGDFQDILPVKPLMELKTIVTMVKEIPPGRSVSYGRNFISDRPMRIATVPIGYADGYHRALSGRGKMLLHGKPANILGKVCMDQLMLDVTDIPQAKAGDIVTVFGQSEDNFLSVDEVASLANTINYEIICDISKRVPRVYLRGGETVEIVDYLRR